MNERLLYVKKGRERFTSARKLLSECSVLTIAKKEFKTFFKNDVAYRTSILKTISYCTLIPEENLATIAQMMDEIVLPFDSVLFNQGDVGDSCYILSDGQAVGKLRFNFQDRSEVPIVSDHFHKDDVIGGSALFTDEIRPVSVVVTSPVARFLRLKRSIYDDFIRPHQLAIDNEYWALARSIFFGSSEVIRTCLIRFTPDKLETIFSRMEICKFQAGSNICVQGKTANKFFIVVKGLCTASKTDTTAKVRNQSSTTSFAVMTSVSLNNPAPGGNGIATFMQKAMNKSRVPRNFLRELCPGDFIGEGALKAHNPGEYLFDVVADEQVICVGLSRSSVLLSEIQTEVTDGQRVAFGVGGSSRRVSGHDINNHVDHHLCTDLLLRLSRFLYIALWDSMYGRLYKELLTRTVASDEYGLAANRIKNQCKNREIAVAEVRREIQDILGSANPGVRDHTCWHFVYGLFNQKNRFKSLYCTDWSAFQVRELCKCLKFQTFSSMTEIIKQNMNGTSVFIILRGAVRIFINAQVRGEYVEQISEDLHPGEFFGEAALEGDIERRVTAFAMTSVDVLVLEADDYMQIKSGHVSKTLTISQKVEWLSSVPLLKHCSRDTINTIARAVRLADYSKGSNILKRGEESKRFYFLYKGTIGIMPKSSASGTRPVALLNSKGFFGESGLINIHRNPNAKTLVATESLKRSTNGSFASHQSHDSGGLGHGHGHKSRDNHDHSHGGHHSFDSHDHGHGHSHGGHHSHNSHDHGHNHEGHHAHGHLLGGHESHDHGHGHGGHHSHDHGHGHGGHHSHDHGHGHGGHSHDSHKVFTLDVNLLDFPLLKEKFDLIALTYVEVLSLSAFDASHFFGEAVLRDIINSHSAKEDFRKTRSKDLATLSRKILVTNGNSLPIAKEGESINLADSDLIVEEDENEEVTRTLQNFSKKMPICTPFAERKTLGVLYARSRISSGIFDSSSIASWDDDESSFSGVKWNVLEDPGVDGVLSPLLHPKDSVGEMSEDLLDDSSVEDTCFDHNIAPGIPVEKSHLYCESTMEPVLVNSSPEKEQSIEFAQKSLLLPRVQTAVDSIAKRPISWSKGVLSAPRDIPGTLARPRSTTLPSLNDIPSLLNCDFDCTSLLLDKPQRKRVTAESNSLPARSVRENSVAISRTGLMSS